MPLSEAAIQTACRIRAGELGIHVWRNNVGACVDATGRMIRYGLANDSAHLSKRLKSSDLIGIIPRDPPGGRKLGIDCDTGVFLSVECKRSDWKWTASDREVAQLAWITLIRKAGGRAGFATSVAQFEEIVLGSGDGAPHA